MVEKVEYRLTDSTLPLSKKKKWKKHEIGFYEILLNKKKEHEILRITSLESNDGKLHFYKWDNGLKVKWS